MDKVATAILAAIVVHGPMMPIILLLCIGAAATLRRR